MSVATEDMTPDEQHAAVLEKMTKLGFHVPPRGAWMESVGRMKDSEHFAEAMRLGAEWRAEENRRSLQELEAES